MIKSIASSLADYVVKHDETADHEVVEYGLELFLHDSLMFLAMLLLALPFGLLLHVLISLVSYHLLRLFAGGVHAKSRLVCGIITAIFLYGTAFLMAKTPFVIPVLAMLPIYFIDLTLLVLYAPADTETMPICRSEVRKALKTKAIALLTVYLIIAALLSFRLPDLAGILVISPTIVCCFTHPAAYCLLGCKKSNITEEKAA